MNLTILLLVFIVVGLPVILGIGSDMLKRWMKHKEKMADVMMQATAEKAAQYAAQTQRLEERVRVLERIVTDMGVALADEIEALRTIPDQRPLN